MRAELISIISRSDRPPGDVHGKRYKLLYHVEVLTTMLFSRFTISLPPYDLR